MPIDNIEIIRAISVIADERMVRVTVKQCGKGAVICAASSFVGGMLLGPLGLALGGAAGGLAAYKTTQGSFRPLAEVLINDLSDTQKERLVNHVRRAVEQFHPSDLVMLAPLILNNVAIQDAVLKTIYSFIVYTFTELIPNQRLLDPSLLRMFDLLFQASDCNTDNQLQMSVYNEKIQELQHEMEECTKQSDRLQNDLENIRERCLVIEGQEICNSCDTYLLVLVDNQGFRVVIKRSAVGGIIGFFSLGLGGLLLGPYGFLAGGLIGGLAAYGLSEDFRPLPDVLMDLSDTEKQKLINHLKEAAKKIEIDDIAVLISLIQSHQQTKTAILEASVGFINNELRLKILDR
uniref:Uncharacterized protein n=1 Tax=Glossina brevipalpis TaxID=37001 RepID=A0A1A9X024_9MUSC